MVLAPAKGDGLGCGLTMSRASELLRAASFIARGEHRSMRNGLEGRDIGSSMSESPALSSRGAAGYVSSIVCDIGALVCCERIGVTGGSDTCGGEGEMMSGEEKLHIASFTAACWPVSWE